MSASDILHATHQLCILCRENPRTPRRAFRSRTMRLGRHVEARLSFRPFVSPCGHRSSAHLPSPLLLPVLPYLLFSVSQSLPDSLLLLFPCLLFSSHHFPDLPTFHIPPPSCRILFASSSLMCLPLLRKTLIHLPPISLSPCTFACSSTVDLFPEGNPLHMLMLCSRCLFSR